MKIIKIGILAILFTLVGQAALTALPIRADRGYRVQNNYYYRDRGYYPGYSQRYYYNEPHYNSAYPYYYNQGYDSYLPPPTSSQAFPDDAAADYLFWKSSQH